MKIKAEDIAALLECTERYFSNIATSKPEFGIPYNMDIQLQKQPLYDYTGHIGITGSHKGGLVITCEKLFVAELVKIVLGPPPNIEEDIIPMIAEMTNTIAGNARGHFGSGFDISLPSVIVGVPDEFKFLLAEPTLIIPLKWMGHSANLIIGLT